MTKPFKVLKMSATVSTDDTNTDETKDVKLSGIANALQESRNGIRIASEAAQGLDGVKVPLLMSHQWESIPVGVATYGATTEEGLPFSATLFSEFDNRRQVLEALAAGVLSVSVGFGITDGHQDDEGNFVVDGVDPLELSLTAVPADPKASAELLALDDDQESEPSEGGEDTEDDNAPTWQDAAEAIKQGLANISAKLNEVLAKIGEQSKGDKQGSEAPDQAEEAMRLLASIYANNGDALEYSMYKQLKTFLNNKEQ